MHTKAQERCTTKSISGKVGFKTRNTTRRKRSLQSDKGVKLIKRAYNPKCVCTQHIRISEHVKVKIDRTKKRKKLPVTEI